MASNYNSLGFQLMTTGEKAGTWGTETNTTWNEVRDTLGYITVAMTADRTLTIPDGSTGTYDGRAMIIECNGALGANRVLDIAVQAGSGSSPGGAANIEKPFIIFNNTSTAYTLTFKVTGATGFVLTQGSTYLCYHNGTDIINTGLVGAATTDTLTNKSIDLGDNTLSGSLAEFNTALQSESFTSLTGAETLTNKTLTSPKFASGGFIADAGGDENLVFTEVSTPVNELRITNAATGNGPILAAISTSTTDSNIDLNINPLGTGVLKSGTAAVKVAGTETIWVPATAMYGETTNGAELAQTVLTAGAPELKAFAFDTTTAEAVQFNVSFPKSWNAGTVTFQTMWSASGTNTGTGGFTLAGCSVASDVDYDLAFGTPVANTSLAASGTQDDLMINVVSGAVTIASVADATNTIFRLVRNVSGDDNTGDLRLVGIKIFYTTDAANDA